MKFTYKSKRTQPLRFLSEALAVLLVLALVALVRPAAAGALDLTMAAALDKVYTLHTNDAEDRFLGSAFLWGDGSVVVTNAHVVGDRDEVRLIDRYGVEETGRVIAKDAARDVAVISVTPGREGLVLAPADAALGDEVFALGAPLGVEFTLTEGRVSATARQVDVAVPLALVQHDAAVNPGSSGGPLVDAEGRLLGMNSQIADGSRMFVGIAYAIGVWLTVRPVDRQVAAALGVPAAGLLVYGVMAGGLAEAAGLMGGDVIVGANGADLVAAGDLAFAVEAASLGGTMPVAVLRDGTRLDLTLDFLAEEEPQGLILREVGAGSPQTVDTYRLSALGLVLDDSGRVTAVTDNSPALFAGITQGDRILTVNGAKVDLSVYEVSEPVLILVAAPGGVTRHIYLDPWGKTDGVRPVGGANVLDPDAVVF
ncbi:MAG: hypothetical protein B7Y02_10820 [Rhodobacterales bacterium 17-64-5]|nr:MAG: hypothetical protein B7Y02_10820 [Rhodobacterales bacterium 17-64-5]